MLKLVLFCQENAMIYVAITVGQISLRQDGIENKKSWFAGAKQDPEWFTIFST